MELNVFSILPTHMSIESSLIEFVILGDSSQYFNLAIMLLYNKAKIKRGKEQSMEDSRCIREIT